MKLRSCYLASLEEAKKKPEIKSLAFCCISTGAQSYPNLGAAHVALDTVRQWLSQGDNGEAFTKIVFCVYTTKDEMIYERLLDQYFPKENSPNYQNLKIKDIFGADTGNEMDIEDPPNLTGIDQFLAEINS